MNVRFPKATIDLGIGGEQAIVGVKHQDALGRSGQRHWCRQESAGQRERRQVHLLSSLPARPAA